MEQTDFVSLGGVWLDEIRRPNQSPVKDMVGGSATYALLGARFFSSQTPSRLALIVNAGNDFPQHVIEELKTWRTRISVFINEERRSTRGILEHRGSAGSSFTRLTPPLLTSPADILAAGAINSKVFHTFAVPDLVQAQCLQIEELRRQHLSQTERPVIIWEPHPKSCTQALLKEHLALLHDSPITVFSPNHHELNAFFDDPSATKTFDRKQIECRARTFLGPPRHRLEYERAVHLGAQVIVIRAAENGCMVMLRNDERAYWLPAFYGSDEQDRVLDPTGAGNAFLGGLSQGWLETSNWIEAACYGMVSASIVVEHVGPPTHRGPHPLETWAGIDVRARLTAYKARPDVRKVLDSSDMTTSL